MLSRVIPGKGKTGAFHPDGKRKSLCALGLCCQGCVETAKRGLEPLFHGQNLFGVASTTIPFLFFI